MSERNADERALPELSGRRVRYYEEPTVLFDE